MQGREKKKDGRGKRKRRNPLHCPHEEAHSTDTWGGGIGEGIGLPRFRTMLIGPADRRFLLITNSFPFFCLAGPVLQPAKHSENLTFVFLLKNAESVGGCAFCRILRAFFISVDGKCGEKSDSSPNCIATFLTHKNTCTIRR